MAAPSLSPKRATQRLLKYRVAVATRAMQLARNATKLQIQAQGLKVSQYSAAEITAMAKAEFERNRDQLVARAKHDIETWPGFEPFRVIPAQELCAQLNSDAQSKIEPISTTSAVQMSGAK